MDEGRSVPRLMLVTDRKRARHPLPELVDAAIAGGVDAIQLREHDLAPSDLADLARSLRTVVADRAELIINGDLALAARLGLGAHLPEAGIATAEARRQVGEGVLLGRSVHSPAAAAASAGTDYLIAGHLFPTSSKLDQPPLGPVGFGHIVSATWAPVFAIGGITAERVVDAVAAGAHGVAVIGAIHDADDPGAAAAALRQALDAATNDPRDTEAQEEPMHQPTTVESGPIALEVNGKPAHVEPDTTVTDFLVERDLDPTLVAVELNGTILARRAFDETFVKSGDRLEVVHFVGGG